MQNQDTKLITPVLLASSIILMIGFGIRASYGVFQIPIADQFAWARTEFSMAIAIQNLAWGIGQPIFGAIAEKIGDRKAILIGIFCYAIGLIFSSYAITPGAHQFYSFFVGFGVAGTGFGVILAIVGRATSDANRSMALGIATAVGSVGQIIGPPTAEFLLRYFNWSVVFLIFAGIIISTIAFLPVLRAPSKDAKHDLEETLGQILKKAFYDPSFTLIFLGFFSCGFQLAFITAHFPAFVTEMCGAIATDGLLAGIGVKNASALGAFSIALIGAANIVGTITAGYFGKHYKKKNLLAIVYTGRTLIAVIFIMVPMTPLTVVTFSITMGLLWLATVPLTSGLVGYIYGLRYMGTLYGIVFFSHQLGSFLGVWLGGALYDAYGNYNIVWWVGIAVGAFSAIVHMPIREIPLGKRINA
ncbi:MFS transporter [Amylibacter sp.]|jgi:MFS family permease|uniref:Permeases of the major facilitator superfamily n=2 Tax=environmental samples TaxID=47925 RepID=E0Y198_9PROT|nr:permeases of the major facilitator superfamily [uncultured alpha proteobacterium EB080_L27A02]ADI20439.1 permeases of the major facilitator superfamily [uncultured alpha proteobacterium EB080_L43F08]MBT3953461.1 MFS transporter [Rhodobacterales bacterium]MCO4796589.1 MFS transporter [Amylibacter sp.]MBT4134142.1 MFS transporter [Rhodobacterales bacterium]